MKEFSKTIIIDDIKLIPELFGIHDSHLREIEDIFCVRISARGDTITIQGKRDGVNHADTIFYQLIALFKEGFSLEDGGLRFILKSFKENKNFDIKKLFNDRIKISLEHNRYIIPKTLVQKEYVYAINNYDVVIGIGPAGTGKTYLAMAQGISDLLHRKVARIILARPAVEAGEKLGYLPGDIYEKVNPYLRPLYDALYDMTDMKNAKRLIENGSIEIAPLAYMRGRTLNDSFVILDEAQNSTPEQMKMFLTRLGNNSKMVITGDITQIDLPDIKNSGLVKIQHILKDIEGIGFVYFSENDVVRHALVKAIIKAYERFEKR